MPEILHSLAKDGIYESGLSGKEVLMKLHRQYKDLYYKLENVSTDEINSRPSMEVSSLSIYIVFMCENRNVFLERNTCLSYLSLCSRFLGDEGE